VSLKILIEGKRWILVQFEKKGLCQGIASAMPPKAQF
jgi:hypothetical protein